MNDRFEVLVGGEWFRLTNPHELSRDDLLKALKDPDLVTWFHAEGGELIRSDCVAAVRVVSDRT